MQNPFLRRCLSVFLAVTLAFSVCPIRGAAEDNDSTESVLIDTAEQEQNSSENVETTSAETELLTNETQVSETDAIAQYQERMDTILIMYLNSTELSSEEIQTAVDAMDWETYQTARMEIRQLDAELSNAQDSGIITHQEIQTLLDANPVFLEFANALEIRNDTENPIDLFSTKTDSGTISGVSYSVSYEYFTISLPFVGSSTTYYGGCTIGSNSITAWAEKQTFSSTTTPITLSVADGTDKYLTFNYSVSGGTCTFTAESTGTQLSGSGSYTIRLTAGVSETFNLICTDSRSTVVLSDFVLEEPPENINVTFQHESLGTVKTGETTIASGSTLEVSLETGIDLVATANSGATFLGWIDMSDNHIISTESSINYKNKGDSTIQAVFVSSSAKAWFLVNNIYLYNDLNAAAGHSGAETVVLMNSGTLPAGNYTIPAGVTLLISFDAANTLYTTEPELIQYNSYTTTTATPYRTLTMADGTNITVNGAISLSAKQIAAHSPSYNAGSPYGAYGKIAMQGSSSITLESGGALYAWGFITGSGSVVAKSGSTVYECFQFQDWRGGNASTAMEDVMPLCQYYVQNIEVPLTLYSGAKEYTRTAVHVDMLECMGTTLSFFAASGALFNMTSGYMTKWYDGSKDRLVMEINGDVTLSSVKMVLGGIYSINTGDYAFPINNNMTIQINSGSTTLNQDVALLPGSEVTIAESGSLVLGEGASLFAYDSAEWGGYCGSNGGTFIPLTYVPSRTYTRTSADLKDVMVQVDGTLDASKGYLYTTAGGANICSTDAGTVIMGVGTQTVTYQNVQNTTYVDIPITPAKLKNADGTYTTTASNSGTYKYINGKWYKTLEIVATNIAVNDGLDVKFYVDAADMVSGVTYSAVITKYFADGRTPETSVKTISSSSWETRSVSETVTYKGFSFEDISAKEMTDAIEVCIYHSDGTQVNTTYTETVQNYAIRTLRQSSTTDPLKTALIDMLNYGTAAQNYFGYNISVLANVDPTDAEVKTISANSSAATADMAACTSQRTYTGNFAGVTVSATNTLMFTFYFNINDPSGMTATVTYTDRNGTSQTKTVTGSDFYKRSEGLYGVDVKGLSIIDGRCLMTCTITDANGTVAAATDSVEGYVARKSDNNNDIFEQMMKFVDSAKAYFDSISS